MAKYSGLVTYVTQVESRPGIWTNAEVSHTMKGDILRKGSTFQNGDRVNGEVTLNHRVSLVADAYALGNYHNMKYIQLDGRDWFITSVEVQRPRIIVTVGGLKNAK